METVSLEYPRAPFGKRIFAFLFDFLCAAVVAAVVAAGGQQALAAMPFYSSASSQAKAIELASGLYVDVDDTTMAVTDSCGSAISSSSVTTADYKAYDDDYEEILAAYYSSTDFFPAGGGLTTYQALKIGSSAISYDSDGTTCYYWQWSYDETNAATLVPAVSYVTLYDFYVTCIDEYAIPSISNVRSDYLEASKILFWSMIVLIAISAAFSLAIFYVVMPLIFRRGRQTLGKKVFKLSVVNASAITPSGKQFAVRSALLYFVELLLGAVSFGIPIILSISMFAFRKDGQSFHDYVAGTYVVDSSDQMVYLSNDEFRSRQKGIDKITLHNAGEIGQNDI